MPETPRTLNSLNILIIEDSINDTALLLTELKSAGFDPQWKRVETEADYLAHLGPDLAVIIADFSLPEFSTIGALALLQESKLEIPFIIVSGTISSDFRGRTWTLPRVTSIPDCGL